MLNQKQTIIELNLVPERHIETWVIGDDRDQVAEYKELLVDAYSSVWSYLRKNKPMMVFPIEDSAKVEGLVFRDTYLLHPNSLPEDMFGAMLVNGNYIRNCLPKADDPISQFCMMRAMVSDEDYFTEMWEQKGLMFIGVIDPETKSKTEGSDGSEKGSVKSKDDKGLEKKETGGAG